jgi:hypothetical protein
MRKVVFVARFVSPNGCAQAKLPTQKNAKVRRGIFIVRILTGFVEKSKLDFGAGRPYIVRKNAASFANRPAYLHPAN